MKFTHKLASILTLVLSVGLMNCGSDGTDTNQFGFGQQGAFSGFYVTSSSPCHNCFYISKNTDTISIRLSQNIASASIPGNVQIVKTYNGQQQNITSAYTISAAGQILTIHGGETTIDTNNDGTPDAQGLLGNTDYEIQLFPGFAADGGNTLLQGQQFQYFYVDFSTSNLGTQGQGVAGKPVVNGVTKSQMGSCFGANIQFNETLAYEPIVNIKYTSMNGLQTVPAYAYPPQPGSMAIWHVDLDGWNCSQRLPFTNFKVEVTNYVDLEGLAGDPYTKTFDWQIFN